MEYTITILHPFTDGKLKMKNILYIIPIATISVLTSSPAYADTTTGGTWAGSAIILWVLFGPAMITALKNGFTTVGIWTSLIPIPPTLMALAVWFNLTGVNPREQNEFTYQSYYEITKEDQKKLDDALDHDCMNSRACVEEYYDCRNHNLCTGHFKFIITDRLRKKQQIMNTVPNATVTTSLTSSKACPIDPDHVNPNSFTEVYERLNNPNCRPKK